MPMGPGAYDAECTMVREKTNAAGVILIVLGGERGNGFSCQTNLAVMHSLPEILRNMADQIERDTNKEPRS